MNRSTKTTESLATLNVAFVATDFISRLDDLIAEPPMIAFLMIATEVYPAEREGYEEDPLMCDIKPICLSQHSGPFCARVMVHRLSP